MLVLWSRKDTYRRRFINCMANPLYTVSDHCLALFLCLVDQFVNSFETVAPMCLSSDSPDITASD